MVKEIKAFFKKADRFEFNITFFGKKKYFCETFLHFVVFFA